MCMLPRSHLSSSCLACASKTTFLQAKAHSTENFAPHPSQLMGRFDGVTKALSKFSSVSALTNHAHSCHNKCKRCFQATHLPSFLIQNQQGSVLQNTFHFTLDNTSGKHIKFVDPSSHLGKSRRRVLVLFSLS